MREDDMDYEDVLQEDVLQKAHQKTQLPGCSLPKAVICHS